LILIRLLLRVKAGGSLARNPRASHPLESEEAPVQDGVLTVIKLDTVPYLLIVKMYRLSKNTSNKLVKSRSTRTCGDISLRILTNTLCLRSNNGGERESLTDLLSQQLCATVNSAPPTNSTC
jgi:hypothetical protein